MSHLNQRLLHNGIEGKGHTNLSGKTQTRDIKAIPLRAGGYFALPLASSPFRNMNGIWPQLDSCQFYPLPLTAPFSPLPAPIMFLRHTCLHILVPTVFYLEHHICLATPLPQGSGPSLYGQANLSF